jgi:hypothetical protein
MPPPAPPCPSPYFSLRQSHADGRGNVENFECWTGSEAIYLVHKPDAANLDMSIDVNNDGTLQTPLGEIKKKGN